MKKTLRSRKFASISALRIGAATRNDQPGCTIRRRDLTLWVSEPRAGKKRYVLQGCRDGTSGEAKADDELRELVDSICTYAILQEG